MRDENAPSVIFQRLTDGEKPETLKEIAKAWGIPRGRFVEWFVTEHAGLYDAAQRVLAGQLAEEALEKADDAAPETVGVAKLQVETRLRLASKLDRERFGERPAGNLADALEGFEAVLQRVSEKRQRALKAAQGEVVDAEIVPKTALQDLVI